MFDEDTLTHPLGSGLSRRVYQHPNDPTKVVKFCETYCTDNRDEWEVWQCANEDVRAHLAPCYSISDDGTQLVMAKTRPLDTIPTDGLKVWWLRSQKTTFRLPPEITWDLHSGNISIYQSRIVAHDYSPGCGPVTELSEPVTVTRKITDVVHRYLWSDRRVALDVARYAE